MKAEEIFETRLRVGVIEKEKVENKLENSVGFTQSSQLMNKVSFIGAFKRKSPRGTLSDHPASI